MTRRTLAAKLLRRCSDLLLEASYLAEAGEFDQARGVVGRTLRQLDMLDRVIADHAPQQETLPLVSA